MLSLQQVTDITRSETSKEIKRMRDDSTSYIRHFFGIGTQAYLETINEYENDKQRDLRRKHAIDNPWVVDELLRPVDNIWQAKGGDLSFEFTGTDKSDELLEYLTNVRGGMSMRQFMKDIWFQRFISDPNGIIFLEVSRDGKRCEFTYKSIHVIHAYSVSGVDINWIAFEPTTEIVIDEEKNENEIKYSWIVDKEYYYFIKDDGKTVEVIDLLTNSFGIVPGVVNSTIYDTESKCKLSLISKQIPLLNAFITKNSVKEIYQFKHNFAKFWMFQTLCPTCNGARKVGNEVCGTCHGSGYSAKVDVSDVFVIPKPDGEVTQPIPPAGYVQPEVSTCEENRKELDWSFDHTFHSLWGTTTEKMNNETATGRFIDVQAVYNKLNGIADIAQLIEKKLTYIIGKFYFPETLKDVHITYSRRYIAEAPDVIWDRYSKARNSGAPITVLNYMLEQFYYAEFASNSTLADIYVKLIYVEPFPHVTDINSVPEQFKQAKIYYSEWLSTLDLSKAGNETIEVLKKQLKEYSQKQITDGKENNPGPGTGATGTEGTGTIS